MRRITEAALATPKGRKKDFGTEMPKGYDPTYVEAAMCARHASLHWELFIDKILMQITCDAGYFRLAMHDVFPSQPQAQRAGQKTCMT